MKLEGRLGWTRPRRAQVAAELAGQIITETSLVRIRALAHLQRKVLLESGDLLDCMVRQYPALDINTHASPAPKKHKVKRK